MPMVDSNHTCLPVIRLDSVLKKDVNYYSQVFWRKCKFIKKKVNRYINDNLSDLYPFDEFDKGYMFF